MYTPIGEINPSLFCLLSVFLFIKLLIIDHIFLLLLCLLSILDE